MTSPADIRCRWMMTSYGFACMSPGCGAQYESARGWALIPVEDGAFVPLHGDEVPRWHAEPYTGAALCLVDEIARNRLSKCSVPPVQETSAPVTFVQCAPCSRAPCTFEPAESVCTTVRVSPDPPST